LSLVHPALLPRPRFSLCFEDHFECPLWTMAGTPLAHPRVPPTLQTAQVGHKGAGDMISPFATPSVASSCWDFSDFEMTFVMSLLGRSAAAPGAIKTDTTLPLTQGCCWGAAATVSLRWLPGAGSLLKLFSIPWRSPRRASYAAVWHSSRDHQSSTIFFRALS
jgi:hypothetical protein